ncbi:MAG TPA: hypothetical protein VNG31_05980 [Candidatus Baltobacteraceae bacterium]|nr:hypothetical protein [Candidatus Baltobacteraceae bacterium]
MKPWIRLGVLCAVAAVLAACSGNQNVVPASTFGGSSRSSATHIGVTAPLRVTAADRAAAGGAHAFSYHLFPISSHWGAHALRASKTSVFHPSDLNDFGGPLMKSAVEHDVYVNCKSNDGKCWGDPEGFLRNVTGSNLVKLLGQYTKAGAGAYTFGEGTPVSYTAYSKIYYDSDLFSILHAAALAVGASGYSNEYHLFLPKGTDTCFDGTTICYSPDNPSTWYFCAYHGEVTFNDVGTVVFSVEPYQNVSVKNVGGCVYPLPKGFNPLVNSTDSTLAHEMFESITDPNPNTFGTLGWYNLAYNMEIGDLCDAFPMVQKVGTKKLYIQTMYSNKYHGCANGP